MHNCFTAHMNILSSSLYKSGSGTSFSLPLPFPLLPLRRETLRESLHSHGRELALRLLQDAAEAVRRRLRLRALLPARGPPQVRHRPQGLRREQRQQDAAGPAGRPEGGRGEQPGVRGERADEGPGVRLRRRDIVPAAAGVAAADAARRRAGRDPVHPDAAGGAGGPASRAPPSHQPAAAAAATD